MIDEFTFRTEGTWLVDDDDLFSGMSSNYMTKIPVSFFGEGRDMFPKFAAVDFFWRSGEELSWGTDKVKYVALGGVFDNTVVRILTIDVEFHVAAVDTMKSVG